MELPRSRRDGNRRCVAGDTEYQAEEWEQELHRRKGNIDVHVGVCCEDAVPG